jgi:hypothetical protein
MNIIGEEENVYSSYIASNKTTLMMRLNAGLPSGSPSNV